MATCTFANPRQQEDLPSAQLFLRRFAREMALIDGLIARYQTSLSSYILPAQTHTHMHAQVIYKKF